MYILALDQGTTSSRAILFDREQNIVAMEQKEYTQIYPREGWVEHDPMEIYSSQYAVMMELMARHGITPADIAAIGIANQRETTILWEKSSGRPIYNAIVWQCRRTAPLVDYLVKSGLSDHIKKTTGLVPDAYFSATKIKWILDNVEGAREKARRGEILFGTVDTWLIWKLSGGDKRQGVHITDYSNASRTMLFDIHRLDWDDTLLAALDIPRIMLPAVRHSSEVYAQANIQGVNIPIAGNAGDQQAALFGQCCFEKGQAKNTYGTGCFLLMNTGEQAAESRNGLITTIAASLPGKLRYALEGSAFVGGAAIQWLRDEMRFITESADSEYHASKVPDTGGVYFVPAFTGLGAPWWDMHARGCITGITRGTKRNHIIRAAVESIAYQVTDLLRAMEKDNAFEESTDFEKGTDSKKSPHSVMTELRADGGASSNNFLMQFQADISGCTIIRPVIRETTALGAACLAGLATGFWNNIEEIRDFWKRDAVFISSMNPEIQKKLIKGWHKAISRTRE